MAQKARSDKSRSDKRETVNETTAEVMAGAKKQYDQFASVQSEFFGECQEASRLAGPDPN